LPQYFFHIRIGEEVIQDPAGVYLRDPDHAWEVAHSLAQTLLKGNPEHFSLLTAAVEVTNEQGEVVMDLPFAEAMLEDDEEEPPTKH
jgi:hypothetical protein